jgi:hypothetical protein
MWNGGIHMESTWNIGGKKSPKWVRSQPKHIPCGMGRFHVEQHGFHMDSTWIPCGIGGQGKDLLKRVVTEIWQKNHRVRSWSWRELDCLEQERLNVC